MIVVTSKEGESIEKMLRRYKKKFDRIGVLRKLRNRQAFEKKSVTRRNVVKKAIHKQKIQRETQQ